VIFAIDFDGTVVEQDKPYADVYSPLVLKPGAREALESLKRAGHTLVLWSGRNNRSRMTLAELDPLVRAGLKVDRLSDESRQLEADRWRQMLAFVASELPGVFDAVDDGRQGKMSADVYIDDKAVRFGGPGGVTWADLAESYGE